MEQKLKFRITSKQIYPTHTDQDSTLEEGVINYKNNVTYIRYPNTLIKISSDKVKINSNNNYWTFAQNQKNSSILRQDCGQINLENYTSKILFENQILCIDYELFLDSSQISSNQFKLEIL